MKSISQDSRYSRIGFSSLSRKLLARVSRWTVWAALIEFLLLRVAIRFGPMLPPSPAVTQGAQVVLLAGTVALNVAVILTTLAVLVIAARSVARSMVLRVLLTLAAALNLIRAISPQGVTPAFDAIFLLHSIVMLAAMVVGATLAVARPAGAGQPQGLPLRFLRRLMLTFLVVIYTALACPAIFATAARLGWSSAPSAQAAFHSLAEGLAVLVALMVYFVYRPARSKLALAVALIATALLGGFWIARPHLASALAQWTVDFTTFLPAWLYLLGLAGFLYTVLGLLAPFFPAGRRVRDEGQLRSRLAAWGLTLIALGGLRWDYTYLSGLGLMGFLLLAEPWQD